MAGEVAVDVEDRVKRLVAETLAVSGSEVTLAAHFVNDLGADSLDTVELVIAVEEEFDVEMPEETAEQLQTVGQLVAWVTAQAKYPGATR